MEKFIAEDLNKAAVFMMAATKKMRKFGADPKDLEAAALLQKNVTDLAFEYMDKHLLQEAK